ncbi:carboxypeptidase B-like [Thrips palmi]|uniref:Carboxypeptidase B-like n=1 Tax=Thrips palmi TaxID=161013 RepID=A0A6P8Z1V1_THRPL|nr:carboxypeptidase B-like [Thrips palmi]
MRVLAFLGVVALVAAAAAATGGKSSSSSGLTFSKIMTYAEVAAYLRALQRAHPRVVRVGSVGRSVEGRDIPYVRVSASLDAKQSKTPVMLVDALMHAREWATLPAALYFLQQAVEHVDKGLDVVVVPVLNPDGYEYSRTKDRLWRKNRSKKYDKKCVGVDLNRNFNFHWEDFMMSGDGASDDPCDEAFAGGEAASEPETKSYQAFVKALNKDKRLKTYVNLHSPSKAIFGPWGYSSFAPTVPDEAKLEKIEKEANAAMVKAGSKSYTISSMAADYASTGAVTDWVRGVAGVKQSFCLELPPGATHEGFGVNDADILPLSRRAFEGLKVFARYAKKPLSQ